MAKARERGLRAIFCFSKNDRVLPVLVNTPMYLFVFLSIPAFSLLSELKDFDAPVPVSGLRHGIHESAGTQRLIRAFVCEGLEPCSLSGASAPAWETVRCA